MWFQVDEAGAAALDALVGGKAVVRAVFERSCYLQGQGGRLVCVGATDIGHGPINALVRQFVAPRMDQCLDVSVAKAQRWQPPRQQALWSSEAIAGLTCAAQGLVPLDGLGGLIVGATSPLILQARVALDRLTQWLVGASARPDAQGLIGLGPGLTPSGDDYLGGLMIGLHSQGKGDKAQALWAWLQPQLAKATNLISASHLHAASQGEGHEALHACIDAVSQCQTLKQVYAGLDRLGHSSGWDAWAGVVAAQAVGRAPPDVRVN